jgi:hypothetical protein
MLSVASGPILHASGPIVSIYLTNNIGTSLIAGGCHLFLIERRRDESRPPTEFTFSFVGAPFMARVDRLQFLSAHIVCDVRSHERIFRRFGCFIESSQDIK